ncbi:MAG: Glu/Leu/Phe/Val dehydrogenase [Microscillaceae bacterium]|nr:Glu/Leu/Phe/Val dehydrogenase [Microscillaceae bacterium]
MTKEKLTSSIFTQISQSEHEQVVFCQDAASGLKAIIAIHNTVLGPAAGGTRMWMYEDESEALHDVLRLSRGMTFKNAIAGLNLGGGKAVIIGDPRKDKTEVLFRSFGKFIKNLNGKYITAEDVGVSTEDMKFIAQETQFVAGKPDYLGGGGDPSPVTAYGVYMGMKAAAKKIYGNDSLEGKKIALQGVGHVGEHLLGYLIKENMRVYISDFYADRAKEVAAKYQVTVVDKESIYDQDVDIYAPCALGATINDDTLKRLKCDIIAGAANNQLADENIHGDLCKEKGILYVPDFLINSGGIINVYYEVVGNYNREQAYKHAEKIYDYTLNIFQKAEKEQTNTHKAALNLALERINSVGRLKMTF